MISDLTEESLVESSEYGSDELCGYFNLPLTQFKVLKQDTQFCLDEPDSDVDFEEKSENLRTSDLSENLSQQLWKVYPYMQLGTLADLMKDFSKMQEIISRNKTSVLAITNILLEVGISLCHLSRLILDKYQSKCT